MSYRNPETEWEKKAVAQAAAYLQSAPISLATEDGNLQYWFTQNEALAIVGHCFSIFREAMPESPQTQARRK